MQTTTVFWRQECRFEEHFNYILMTDFSVTKPGTRPLNQSNTVSSHASSLLSLLETSYADAIVGITLFEESNYDLSAFERLGWEDKEKYQGKRLFFLRRAPFVHARTFLYALDVFQETLSIIKKLIDVPSQADTALTAFSTAFPNLRAIRNSAHHPEQRVQGIGQNGPIATKPISSSGMGFHRPTEGGPVMTEMLSDSAYGLTLGNGTYTGEFSEVEVSALSLTKLQLLYQNLLNSFSWDDTYQRSIPYLEQPY